MPKGMFVRSTAWHTHFKRTGNKFNQGYEDILNKWSKMRYSWGLKSDFFFFYVKKLVCHLLVAIIANSLGELVIIHPYHKFFFKIIQATL